MPVQTHRCGVGAGSPRQREHRAFVYYLRRLWARKWLVLEVLILVPAAVYYFESTKPALYQGQSQVVLAQPGYSTLLGVETPELWSPGRTAQTDARVAGSPLLAERVMRRLSLADRDPADLVAATSITPIAGADVLEFAVTDPDPALARRLATAYAEEYVPFRRELDTLGLRRARDVLEDALASAERRDDLGASAYLALTEKLGQVEAMEALQPTSTYVVRPAGDASLVAPQSSSAALSSLPFAAILAAALALVFDALRRRAARPAETARELGVPFLGNISSSRTTGSREYVWAASRCLRRMRARHLGSPEEARADQERSAGTCVLVTSVLGRGPKTTVSAETALGLAVDGYDVVLVDFDSQSPTLHRQFDSVEQSPGISDVLGGRIGLERALSRVALHPGGRGGEALDGSDAKSGGLRVLAAGLAPSTGRGDVRAEAAYDLIDRLGRACDFLIIDAPPVLSGNEVRDLSRLADGLLIVVEETSSATDVQPEQLRFALASFDAEIVGVVGIEAQAAEVVSIVPARKAALAHGD